MANKPRHRRFGNIRKRASGRYQIRYPGPDGRMRAGPETYERKSDAERALSLIEAQMISGEWADSDRSKIKLQDYATYWIAQRAGLRPRTVDLYTWLCGKHINPTWAGVPLGRLDHTDDPRMARAKLLRGGVSVSMAAKAYRLLRSILTTAVEGTRSSLAIRARVRGAGTGANTGTPVLTVAQVFELAELVGRRQSATSGACQMANSGCGIGGMASCEPHLRSTPQVGRRGGSVWTMGTDGRADYDLRPPLPRPGAPGRLRQPALGRGNRASPLRPGPSRRHRPSARRLRRTVNWGTGAGPTEVEGSPPHRRHPVIDRPSPARAHFSVRRAGGRSAHLPWGQGRTAAPQQLQQDGRLAPRRPRDRRSGPALS